MFAQLRRLLAGQYSGTFGHRRADVVRLGDEIEAAGGRLIEDHLRGGEWVHRGGFDIEHGRALLLGSVGVPGIDSARGFEDVGDDGSWQDEPSQVLRRCYTG